MSRHRNKATNPAEEPEAQPLELSEPTIYAQAVYPDGFGWRQVRLKLPIEVVEAFRVDGYDPENIGVVSMRLSDWACMLPQDVAEDDAARIEAEREASK